ncbi:hypothetical protein CBER1_11732 [Cercospora berteroae]|uniref:Uncharacterized protein n=1 Tax=Cercospora berteroae TaxID=357750 RepID=A0A2S6C0C9_9PEZI|nr:hypothetical protein CBER1_11732 [Cercospora berteroae]
MNSQYTMLSHSELDHEEDASYSKKNQSGSFRCTLWLPLLLGFSVLMNIIFILYILTTGRDWTTAPSCEQRRLLGYDTELYEARKVVEQTQVQFDGGFTFAPNMGGTYLHFTGPERYFGTPSPAIDQVWGELLKGEYIGLNESEATGVKHTLYDTNPDGSKLYFNEARKFIDSEYYADPTWSDAFKRVNRLHLDHCMSDHVP